MSKLYIKKEFRGLGIGKSALKKIIHIAQEYNRKKIVLTVKKDNINTIKAYESWGFKITDSIVTDIGSGFVMDDFIMEYELQEN